MTARCASRVSEDEIVGTVSGALSAALLEFRPKAKPKPRARKPRPANDHDDGVPLDTGAL